MSKVKWQMLNVKCQLKKPNIKCQMTTIRSGKIRRSCDISEDLVRSKTMLYFNKSVKIRLAHWILYWCSLLSGLELSGLESLPPSTKLNTHLMWRCRMISSRVLSRHSGPGIQPVARTTPECKRELLSNSCHNHSFIDLLFFDFLNTLFCSWNNTVYHVF